MTTTSGGIGPTTSASPATAKFNLPVDDSDGEDESFVGEVDDEGRSISREDDEDCDGMIERESLNDVTRNMLLGRKFLMDDPEDDVLRIQRELAISTLHDVFRNDLQIFQTVDDNIHETWMPKPPKIICNYLFGKEIGSGSYGKVKEVLHRDTGLRRAIKIIKDKKVSKIPGGISNVEREVAMLQFLDHPNVVRLIESFRVESREKLYLIFEFCITSVQNLLDGAPLNRMNEYQAHYYFRHLISGLGYLHDNGIIHKDIKPENLLITLENVLKIADFGVADKLTDPDNDWSEHSQGTPAFQAPEVVDGRPQFRGKCIDVWATGVSLYRITAGVYPFGGSYLLKLFDNIVKDQFKLPTDVDLSPLLVDLLTGMLIKDPVARWDIARIKQSKWFSMEHQPDHHNLISLPAVDNSFFDETIRQLEDNLDNIQLVEDATPFTGTYPANVKDKTLQAPPSNRDFPCRTIDLNSEPDDNLRPSQLTLNEDANLEGVRARQSNSLPASTTSGAEAKRAPRRHRARRFLNCFRPVTSPNASPD